ncbi:Formin-like protein 7 [Hibiscus syriacus]|uniref:Formin-like protein n=1 Tax=Hibiscus syriacus TaxID=106335 RepID=A0A6A2XBK5_HIBSY|nr:formin-like protein 8 [Hibiscus syriacus]KAE8672953.1 Formin-like protein 7 [Hibiscus syriacus]
MLLLLPFSSSQASPQNIEVLYPTQTPPPPWSPSTTTSSSGNEADGTIAKAVAVTAGITIVIAAVFFFFIRRYDLAQGKRERVGDSSRPRVPLDEFARVDGNIKGLIVDENGLDVLYWRQLQNEAAMNGFQLEVLHVPKDEEEEEGGDGGGMFRKGDRSKKIEPTNEFPLLRGKSSASHVPPPPMPPPPPPKSPAPPPPPPKKAGGLVTSLKPPPAARNNSGRCKAGESSGDGDDYQVKLKPLHWDKVNKKHADHSMVWDKINGGSFTVDDNLMEALFGYVATNKKSPTSENNSKSASQPAQIMVLDARKSQNISIVLKSLALSRNELLDALNEGQGLDADTLEKLVRIAPNEEEQSQILDFDGDPTRLAGAESFLFHILKVLPSAFTRLNAMQFRSNYDLEILHMKECLQTLELGCKELRSQRLFMKLLEAILKAGNHMNAGTARGDAQAFNLTSLLKLYDVKSTDGKTTLLHFVVEEVVRSQGKKCFISRSHSLIRSSSSNSITGNSTSKVDRKNEYIMLGLPVVGGLSAEFYNVKKAASIDFYTFSDTCSAIAAGVAETKQLVSQCMADGKGGFEQEMKGFIDDAEAELKVFREEKKRVMEIVRITTEYYQAGSSKDPFQVFVIVKDFLGMVDQACLQIARNQQSRNAPTTANNGPQSPNSQGSRTKMRFPLLPSNFMSDKSWSSSSESDEDS